MVEQLEILGQVLGVPFAGNDRQHRTRSVRGQAG
jgi:hypothetical protein